MLLVVFGAGASFDSVASLPAPRSWREDGQQARPPLADQLFDDRPRFGEASGVLEYFRPILPLLRHRGVEQTMQRLQAEAATNPERHSQLTAVRYYLQFILWGISHDWRQEAVRRHGSNYHTLLDLIAHYRKAGEAVALVTFNYDTLLEDALSAVKLHANTLSDYIAHDYKVFKLHGSVNWAHPIKTAIDAERHFWSVFAEKVSRAAELEISEEIQMIQSHLLSGPEQSPLYPAIAIPLEEKIKFECPPEHVEELRNLLPEITRFLIVGWRATEAPFLELLVDRLPPEVHGLIVCGSETQAIATIAKLQGVGVDTSDFRPSPLGFSNFILGEEIRKFIQ